MKKNTRLKRFHREFYFPDWFEESLESYLAAVHSNGPITFSLHSLNRMVEICFEHGRKSLKFLMLAIKTADSSKVFEFYSTEEKIKKACFRFSFEDYPVDIILVVSADGVIITIYVINKEDNHDTLDKNLYERKP